MNEKKVHEGRNIKRFREMLGLKQDALAFELGDDWTQKKISQLEAKETVDITILQRVSEVLKIPVEAFQNFDEEQAINFIANTFHDSAVASSFSDGAQANFNCSFNPLNKVIELYEENKQLYERMLKEKDELLRQFIEQQARK